VSQDKYFREELAFLKEQGAEFTQVHPQLSRFLNGGSTDPDVERLLEGFAFLTGRLRAKVEDEFPELTHSIIGMLWPNYLRPVPSMTIVKFFPTEKSISARQQVKKGTYLDSKPVLDTVCQFRTCRDMDVYPLECHSVETTNFRDSSEINLDLKILGDQRLVDIDLADLRFYIGGQSYSAQMLYLWLSHYLTRIDIVSDGKQVSIPKSCFKLAGFDSQDALLSYPKNVYEGYRILQEYLSFQEAFLFFDLKSIGEFVNASMSGNLTIRFSFSKMIPADVRIREECFQLYCTPAINLFEHDADPIDLNGKSSEYRITPSSRHPANYEIFSVDKVEGWQDTQNGRERGKPRLYTPFESFQHEIERTRHRKALYYRIRVKDSIRNDGFDHFMSFVRSDETTSVGVSEAVSLRITCSNRQLPLELGCGDICQPTASSPTFATFENIIEPTQALRPVLDGSLLWTLISNLSLNYLSLLSKDALSAVLRAYDFRALVDRQAEIVAQQRLQGITKVTSKPIEKIMRGLPVRGLQSEITLDQSAFGSEGDLYLFGTVLSRFFTLYASINSFHELVVINSSNNERYTWGAKIGVQPLI